IFLTPQTKPDARKVWKEIEDVRQEVIKLREPFRASLQKTRDEEQQREFAERLRQQLTKLTTYAERGKVLLGQSSLETNLVSLEMRKNDATEWLRTTEWTRPAQTNDTAD